ncbi:hypothetical protein J2Z21_003986 [Streptomyces griseochromogenes]|uniref:Secreted protein n=1 Tax=Streptomyces griseochromogenes TaxID=68214 RepID=A0A1B1BBA2_9ACTN|nr:hypothetical protein [Streptomyces griseochromogenes]ANP56098.1 hypothetical protein AVL59_46665 [Streptomyces griseochromogenes]MBP2051036.1 hypothetical protein [Streptomyces griseochromogenes]
MNLTLGRLLGATAAVAMGATALLGTGAGTADARGERAHCDRAEQPIWIDDPSRNVTAHGCSVPDSDHRWYIVEVDTLVQPHHKTEYLNGAVDRTKTLHNRTIRCLGYTSDKDTVNWFGCVPN